jgi:hypothetical protein
MAVLVIGTLPGGDAATDTRLQQEMGIQGAPPAGALARFAGPTPSGWRVVTVWETEESFRTFEREKLLPAFERLGLSLPPREVAPLDNYRIAPQ